MGWFRVSRGRLEYRGITREPFTLWTDTKEGAGAVASAARGIRFSLIGRSRSGRRRIWRALEAAARETTVVTAIGVEAGRYMEVLASLSYSDGLPRANVALRRLVLVPRAMIAGRARAGLFERLGQSPALSELPEAVRTFFLDQLLTEMDAALQRASPSPRHPIPAVEEWMCVGVSKGLMWMDPLWAGADGTGHVFMYEVPRAGLSSRERKALEAAVSRMAASVSSLSRSQRFEMLRAVSLR